MQQERVHEPVATPVNSVAVDRPRIVALTHEFFPRRGGIAVYTEEVARAVAASGHRIEVWAPKNDLLSKTAFEFPVQELPLRGTQGWLCRIQLARFMRRNRERWEETVLWLPEPGPLRTWMYMHLFDGHRIKGLVVTLHGSEIAYFTSSWHRRNLFLKLLTAADRIGVVSRFSRDMLIQHFPSLESKVVIAHGGLRTQVQISDAEPTGRLKNGKVVILTVGRIHPRKGQMAVVEALHQLPPELRKRFSYWVAGPVRREAYKRQIETFAAEHDIDVRFIGEVEDSSLNALYAKADIFAMTSQPVRHSVEGFGLSYLEASARGLPVVAHRTGGVGDAVRNGVTGIKVEPGDRAGLAQAFATLASDEHLRRTLGSNGREWARSFTWDRTASILFDGIETFRR